MKSLLHITKIAALTGTALLCAPSMASAQVSAAECAASAACVMQVGDMNSVTIDQRAAQNSAAIVRITGNNNGGGGTTWARSSGPLVTSASMTAVANYNDRVETIRNSDAPALVKAARIIKLGVPPILQFKSGVSALRLPSGQISQTGDANRAFLEIKGDLNAFGVRQNGADNHVSQDVSGSANSVAAAQSGDMNSISQQQKGNGNLASAAQSGYDNRAVIAQTAELALLSPAVLAAAGRAGLPTGGNSVILDQQGGGNRATLEQTGNGNGIGLRQLGNASMTIEQRGNGHQIGIEQGAGSTMTITQSRY